MDELRERIADTRPTAGEVTPIDTDALVRRGRRQRRTVQAATGLAGAVVVVVIAFGLGRWSRRPPQGFADERGPQLVDAPIGLLDKPAGPQTGCPTGPRRGGSRRGSGRDLRLARTTPTHRWFVYLDDNPSHVESTDRVVCLLPVEVGADEAPNRACGGYRVPASSKPQSLLVTSAHPTAGIITDGANRIGQASGIDRMRVDVDQDLPVVNNVFVNGPPLEIVPDVHLVWDHIRGNMSPDDPASQPTDSFPPPVQAAGERVDSYAQTNCPPHTGTLRIRAVTRSKPGTSAPTVLDPPNPVRLVAVVARSRSSARPIEGGRDPASRPGVFRAKPTGREVCDDGSPRSEGATYRRGTAWSPSSLLAASEQPPSSTATSSGS